MMMMMMMKETTTTAILAIFLVLLFHSKTTLAAFPLAENAWIPPTADDVRSPCPFINTLANHGFIERSGKGVDLFDMVDQLEMNFDVKRTLFDKLAAGAIAFNFTYVDGNGTTRLDIDQLFAHNKQEHDASFVRADEYFGQEQSKLVDPVLLASFLNDTAPDSTVLSFEDIMAFQTKRIQHSYANNPQVKIVAGQNVTFSAQPTFWLTFGQQADLQTVDKESLREFLTFERFPEGYTPLAISSNGTFVPHDVLETGTLASDIRLQFAANFLQLVTAANTSSVPTAAETSSAPTLTLAPPASFLLAAAASVLLGGM